MDTQKMTFNVNKPHNCAYVEMLMQLQLNDFIWHIAYTSISSIYINYSEIRKK